MSIARYVEELAGLLAKPHTPLNVPSAANDPFHDLIIYLRTLINREDLLDPFVKEYSTSLNLSDEERIVAYVHLYASFEDVIVHNKPPIVKSEFTKASLRADIASHVPVDKLPLLVKLFFLNEQERRTTLCFVVLHYIADFINESLGPITCRQYLEDLVKGSAFEKLLAPEGSPKNVFVQLDEGLFHVNTQEARFLWLRIFNGLYERVTASLGEKLVKEHFEKAYDIVKQTNDYEIISELFEVFPKDITEKDRLQYLSREELEKKVIAATKEEKEKRNIIEKLAHDLQEKVEDLHKGNINILAYEKALEEAKANVERQVEERTKQLRESQERLFKFLENIPVGVFVFDRSGAPYYVNAELKRLIGNDIHDLASLGPIKKAYLGESSAARDIEIDRGEKRIQLEIFASPVFDSLNKVEFVVAAFHDITEEKVLERSKDEFFSIASHELRTPLTAIRGLAWILREEYAPKVPDKEFASMINDVYTSSVRLIDLVNDFLNMSRLEQGRMIYKNELFDLKALVLEVVKEYSISAGQKGLFLKGDVDAVSESVVFADRSKVKEVLINFIGNALKFTHTGGITLHLSKEMAFWVVRVEDTGSGIPRENQTLLFRKFQQAGKDIYARDMSQGTGLGLYISKLMIQGMGGSIGLEGSTAGKGSVFFFSLPLAKNEHASTMTM